MRNFIFAVLLVAALAPDVAYARNGPAIVSFAIWMYVAKLAAGFVANSYVISLGVAYLATRRAKRAQSCGRIHFYASISTICFIVGVVCCLKWLP